MSGPRLRWPRPRGGQPPLDPKSDAEDAQTDDTRRFKSDEAAKAELANTHRLSEVKAEDFDAVFYPGGHGPLWDLANDSQSIALIEAFARAGKPTGFVCHAPGVLKDVKGADGEPLVKGRSVTGFTNSEEEGVGLVDVVPFLVETMLAEKGGRYSKGEDWASYVLTDGTLVTGQNPASSREAAEALLKLLKA